MHSILIKNDLARPIVPVHLEAQGFAFVESLALRPSLLISSEGLKNLMIPKSTNRAPQSALDIARMSDYFETPLLSANELWEI